MNIRCLGTLDASRPRNRPTVPALVRWWAVLTVVIATPGFSQPGDDTRKEIAAASSAADQRPLCSLFTADEIGRLLGTPVAAGQVAGPMGSSCQWDGTKDEDAYAHIQVLDAKHWTKPRGARGYEELKGIGREAYVVPELGGWAAGALLESKLVSVAVVGGKSRKETAVKLLRDAIARL